MLRTTHWDAGNVTRARSARTEAVTFRYETDRCLVQKPTRNRATAQPGFGAARATARETGKAILAYQVCRHGSLGLISSGRVELRHGAYHCQLLLQGSAGGGNGEDVDPRGGEGFQARRHPVARAHQ